MNQLSRARVDSQIEAIIDRTITEIEQQGSLPCSPCEACDGRMLFSAGALATRVSVSVLCSEEEAVAFENQLAKAGDKSLVLQRAIGLGLPVELIDMMFRINDGLAAPNRVNGVLAYLRGLKAVPAWAELH
jgi:hypothetical protein